MDVREHHQAHGNGRGELGSEVSVGQELHHRSTGLAGARWRYFLVAAQIGGE
jgi:hypothetical protein